MELKRFQLLFFVREFYPFRSFRKGILPVKIRKVSLFLDDSKITQLVFYASLRTTSEHKILNRKFGLNHPNLLSTENLKKNILEKASFKNFFVLSTFKVSFRF